MNSLTTSAFLRGFFQARFVGAADVSPRADFRRFKLSKKSNDLPGTITQRIQTIPVIIPPRCAAWGLDRASRQSREIGPEFQRRQRHRR